MDVVGLSKNGIENVVANLGTSLTDKQILTLNQFFDDIIICFDGDESGYKAALRAPDHAWLRPTKFIQVMESGLDKLSDIFEKVAIETKDEIPKEIMDKYKKAPFRAPLIIIVVSSYKHHPKVPNIEQKLSSAAAAQNILLAADDLGYGAIWRTGIFAFNENINKYLNLSDDDTVIGYLYIGTKEGKQKNIPNLDIKDFVSNI